MLFALKFDVQCKHRWAAGIEGMAHLDPPTLVLQMASSYCTSSPSLVPRPSFFFLYSDVEKEGLVYTVCACAKITKILGNCNPLHIVVILCQ